jgi:hypothetical protein
MPLKVTYADRVGIVDNYEFRLNVLVDMGEGFDYVYFYTWYFTDMGDMATGDDGVTDFVIGDCVFDGMDLILPPWMDGPN